MISPSINKRTGKAILLGFFAWLSAFWASRTGKAIRFLFLSALFLILAEWCIDKKLSPSPEGHWRYYALAEAFMVLAGVFFGMLWVLVFQGGRRKRVERAGLKPFGKLKETLDAAKKSLEEAEKKLEEARKDLKCAEAEEEAARVAFAKTVRPAESADDVIRRNADVKAAYHSAKTKSEQAKTSAKVAGDEVEKKKKEVKETETKLKTPGQKMLQPEYAIGQGLITRDDYNALQNEYLAQSDLSVGLVVPLAFLLFALAMTPQLGEWNSPWLLRGLGVMTAVLVILGLDRRHKYRVELQSLILGSWVKKTEAAKAAKEAANKVAKEASDSQAWPASPPPPPKLKP
jgi:hypothetical protein